MYCRKCGKQNQDTARFCVGCGTPILSKNDIAKIEKNKQEAASQQTNPNTREAAASQWTNPNAKNAASTQQVEPRKKGSITRVLAAVMIVVLIFAGGSYVGKKVVLRQMSQKVEEVEEAEEVRIDRTKKNDNKPDKSSNEKIDALMNQDKDEADKDSGEDDAAKAASQDTNPEEEGAGSIKTVEKGKLLVGMDVYYPPFSYIQNDRYEGIDVEIAREIAKRMNLDLVIREMDYDSVITAVMSEKVDLSISGITITDERANSVAFSEPYFDDTCVLVTHGDSSIKVIEDFKDPKLEILSVEYGKDTFTNNMEWVLDEIGFEGTVTRVQRDSITAEDLAASIDAKLADACLCNLNTAEAMAAANSKLVIQEDLLQEAYYGGKYGIAVNKENTEMLKKIDAIMEDMRADGTLAKILEEYNCK